MARWGSMDGRAGSGGKTRCRSGIDRRPSGRCAARESRARCDADERVFRWQNDDAAGSFSDGNFEAGGCLAIITPPSRTRRRGTVAPPAASIASPMVMPTGNAQRDRCGDGAGHGQVLVGHGTVEPRCSSAFQRWRPPRPHLWAAAGRNHAAGDQVHEDEFVAGG